MKGLLLKDWYMLRHKFKLYIIIAFLLMIIFGYLSATVNSLFYNGAFLAEIMIGILPWLLYNTEEQEKWSVLSETLPISRTVKVDEKYIISIVLSGIITVLDVIFSLIIMFHYHAYDFEILSVTTTEKVVLAFMIPGILLFVDFGFGNSNVSKTIGLLATIFLVEIAISVYNIVLFVVGTIETQALLFVLRVICCLVILVCIVAYTAFWAMAIEQYKKREF